MAKDVTVKLYGVKDTIAEMKRVEPTLLKDLRRNIRQIAAPGVSGIKSVSPTVAPLSGMSGNGRTAYSPPKITVSVTPGQRSRGFGSTTANLVTITATGSGKKVGFDIADLAGRANQPNKYPRTRSFVDPRTGQTVRRRVNGQGRALIAQLRGQGQPSRYVYKGLEGKLPAIREEVAQVIRTTMKDFTRRLNK